MTATPLGTPASMALVRRSRRRASPGAVSLALAAPTLCIFAGLVAIPVVSVVLTSLTSWTGFDITGITWLGIDEPWSNAGELGSAAMVADQDTDNLMRIQRGLRASRKPGVTLARYQESRIRHFHATLDAYLSGNTGAPHA